MPNTAGNERRNGLRIRYPRRKLSRGCIAVDIAINDYRRAGTGFSVMSIVRSGTWVEADQPGIGSLREGGG